MPALVTDFHRHQTWLDQMLMAPRSFFLSYVHTVELYLSYSCCRLVFYINVPYGRQGRIWCCGWFEHCASSFSLKYPAGVDLSRCMRQLCCEAGVFTSFLCPPKPTCTLTLVGRCIPPRRSSILHLCLRNFATCSSALSAFFGVRLLCPFRCRVDSLSR